MKLLVGLIAAVVGTLFLVYRVPVAERILGMQKPGMKMMFGRSYGESEFTKRNYRIWVTLAGIFLLVFAVAMIFGPFEVTI